MVDAPYGFELPALALAHKRTQNLDEVGFELGQGGQGQKLVVYKLQNTSFLVGATRIKKAQMALQRHQGEGV